MILIPFKAIVEEGEVANEFYFLEEGNVVVSKGGSPIMEYYAVKKVFVKFFAKFFEVFAKFFKVFASFLRFSRAFRGFRIHSDPLGCIRMHSEAIGSVWTFSNFFEIFWIFESFFNVSGRNFYKRLFSRHNNTFKK